MTAERTAEAALVARIGRWVTRGAAGARMALLGFGWLRIAVMLVGLVILSIPLLWMIGTSLKDAAEVFRYPPDLIPRSLHWENYLNAVTANFSGTGNPSQDKASPLGFGTLPPLILFTSNTLKVAAAVVIGSIISNSLVAFGFGRLRFWGRDVAFAVMLATMMLPSQVTMIPIFTMFRNLGWLDTYLPLTVPAFFSTAWLVFLFRQYIMTIPLELDDAARIDGCSTFGIFWWLIMPLSRPIVVTIALFSFAGVWNDYFGPLIYLSSFRKWTISIGLANFSTMVSPGQQVTPYHLLMAAALIVSIPMMLIFFFLQGTFVRSVVLSGLKG
jgi:multiple sugar transport system permease protein